MCGGLDLARNEGRLTALRRLQSIGRCVRGCQCFTWVTMCTCVTGYVVWRRRSFHLRRPRHSVHWFGAMTLWLAWNLSDCLQVLVVRQVNIIDIFRIGIFHDRVLQIYVVICFKKGALWTPGSGVMTSSDVCTSLLKGATKQGNMTFMCHKGNMTSIILVY